MPCWMCTTGSPIRSSDRSRTIVSTLLRVLLRACRRARTRAWRYSSVSVSMEDRRLARVEAGVQRATQSANAESALAKPHPSTTSGLKPYSAKYCCIVSRRPADRRRQHVAPRPAIEVALQRAQRIVARRSTATRMPVMLRAGRVAGRRRLHARRRRVRLASRTWRPSRCRSRDRLLSR